MSISSKVSYGVGTSIIRPSQGTGGGEHSGTFLSLVNRPRGAKAPGGARSKRSKKKKGPAEPEPPIPLNGTGGKYKTEEDFVSNG